jgi:hypothetical protein
MRNGATIEEEISTHEETAFVGDLTHYKASKLKSKSERDFNIRKRKKEIEVLKAVWAGDIEGDIIILL